MKKLIKYGIGLALTAIIGIAAHIFYLYSLSPTENYPEDTYLKIIKNFNWSTFSHMASSAVRSDHLSWYTNLIAEC